MNAIEVIETMLRKEIEGMTDAEFLVVLSGLLSGKEESELQSYMRERLSIIAVRIEASEI